MLGVSDPTMGLGGGVEPATTEVGVALRCLVVWKLGKNEND